MDWATEGARLTAYAVGQVVHYMPARAYEIRLIHRDPDGGPIINRQFDRAQLLRSVSYLRGMNRKGYHVFFRPGAAHFVYVDDVSDDDIDGMRADGIRPVLVYETSEGLHHAWVQLANRSDQVTEDEATEARRILAERYRGDRGATGKNQLGRLPGFRNVKPEYEDGVGGHPLVKIRHASFGPVATAVLDEAKQGVENGSSRLPPFAPLGPRAPYDPNIDPSRSPMTPDEAIEIYEAELRIQADRNGWELPIGVGLRSDADYHVAQGLYLKHQFEPDDIAFVLLNGSEKAAERGIAYVVRTVNAACGAFNPTEIEADLDLGSTPVED